MATSAVSSLQFQLEQVTKERDTLRNSASLVAFQAHQIDGDIAASLLERGRSECVTKVREYLTDCRDEERGIIKAIALELEQLK
jgi:precorrin-6B methylase 1